MSKPMIQFYICLVQLKTLKKLKHTHTKSSLNSTPRVSNTAVPDDLIQFSSHLHSSPKSPFRYLIWIISLTTRASLTFLGLQCLVVYNIKSSNRWQKRNLSQKVAILITMNLFTKRIITLIALRIPTQTSCYIKTMQFCVYNNKKIGLLLITFK